MHKPTIFMTNFIINITVSSLLFCHKLNLGTSFNHVHIVRNATFSFGSICCTVVLQHSCDHDFACPYGNNGNQAQKPNPLID